MSNLVLVCSIRSGGRGRCFPVNHDEIKGNFSAIPDRFRRCVSRCAVTCALRQRVHRGVSYLKVIGWGWFYLSTVLDDYSHYVIAWLLSTTMKASDVTATLEDALVASGCDQATVAHRPWLLSDNGSSYISGELSDRLADEGMNHVRGAPRHPQTQGKIKRWHQTLKNRILLESYYLPGALEQAIGVFIDYYNHHRYHESLGQPRARRRLS